MEEPDQREQLYKAFKEALQKGEIPDYDEFDLVEIFDYASDCEDTYIRMEALFLGARLYPDSEELRMRRGFLYCNIDQSLAKDFLKDHPQEQGALWDLLQLVSGGSEQDKAQTRQSDIDALENILSSYDTFSDEEVIQLCQAAESLDLVDWLKDNLSRIRSHVTYLPTLLYEAAQILANYRYTREAIALYEELTENMPFEHEFWYAKSLVHVEVEEDAEAETAIDYALALEPDNPEYIMVKARLEMLKTATVQEGLDRLKAILDNDDFWMDALRYLDIYWTFTAAHEEALEYFHKLYPRREMDQWMIDRLVMHGSPMSQKLLDQLCETALESDEEMWFQWAEGYALKLMFDRAEMILDTFARKRGLTTKITDLAYYMLRQNKIEEAYNLLHPLITSPGDVEMKVLAPATALFAVTLAKKGLLGDGSLVAEYYCKKFENIENNRQMEDILLSRGAIMILSRIGNMCDAFRQMHLTSNPFDKYTVEELLFVPRTALF